MLGPVHAIVDVDDAPVAIQPVAICAPVVRAAAVIDIQHGKTATGPILDLRALREAVGLTQDELAQRIAMTQSQLSKLERREDHRLSTLSRYVTALGGQLEIVAVVQGKRIRLLSHHQG